MKPEIPTAAHRVKMLREGARQIRTWVDEVCSNVAQAQVWLAVASLREQRADLIELEARGLATAGGLRIVVAS
jgi:predicted transcriptional regulator